MDNEENGAGIDSGLVTANATGEAGERAPARDLELVKRIVRTITEDKRHHDKAFKRMRRDMFVAAHGREKNWPEEKYTANVVGRHINQKVAQLYAKNPKATARRRDTLDFKLWDESPQSLMLAYQGLQQAQMAMQQAQMDAAMLAAPDATSIPVVGPDPQLIATLQMQAQQAQVLIMDAQQGIQRRQQMKKFGRTLEVLFAHALRDQNPLEFKAAMKQMVRRACTTGVGYVELGFQREYGPRPDSVNKLADFKSRIDHIGRLLEEADEGEIGELDAEMAELERAVAALQEEPEVLLREGLVFDFPAATAVIPDKNTRHLVGFVGADHVTVQYLYSPEKVEEVFGVDLGGKFTPYQIDGSRGNGHHGDPYLHDENQLDFASLDKDKGDKDGYVCVWKHYQKASGLVYYVADGHDGFLREPGPPDVKVDDFWPVRALTFNAVENEEEIFPPSDVTLLLHQQREINRSREGLREHRNAARPRWVFPKGALDDSDIEGLQSVKPFDAIGLNMDPQSDIGRILQPMPVPGVDPNLYATEPHLYDMNLVAGAQSAQLGATSKSTATESAIAADSTATASGSNIDDLDEFLTWTARSSGQILLRELAPEVVLEKAGVGSVWPGLDGMPEFTAEQIADEVFLEVEAGSTGKPNQATEVRNWKEMLPFLLQIPGIDPVWLGRETLRRLDDRMDLTEAVVSGLPAIAAQNRQAQPAVGPVDQNQQGDRGGDKATAPGGPAGSSAPMGDNHGV